MSDLARASAAAAARGGEVLQMRWKFTGFFGALAGLFVPSRGDALLTSVPAAGGERTEIELLVTAPKREGEYFLYGAAIDRRTGSTTEVWSSYLFRGKSKDRELRPRQTGVIDFASAIHHLRWNPPPRPTPVTIWHGGRTYPAQIEPLGTERRKISGKKREVRGYLVRGLKRKGEPHFKDEFFVYFARDERSTPVEIVGKRGWVRVRFQLVEPGEYAG